jgi:hypothetical protein
MTSTRGIIAMMTWPRPFHSVALVLGTENPRRPVFLGTCFAYRSRLRFLTAAHCVGEIPASQLTILLPLSEHDDIIGVDEIIRHPAADLAVLAVSSRVSDEVLPFVGLSAIHTWGHPVDALGFPEDSDFRPTPEPVQPTARYFSGTIQRFYTHTSVMGYIYQAGELSFGAPSGLSGGPVFTPQETDRIVGVVAENRDTTTHIPSARERTEGGASCADREVIRYGVFVSLTSVSPWLDKVAPEG